MVHDEYRETAEAAWAWVLDHVADDEGPWMPEKVTGRPDHLVPTEDRDCLYAGIAGLAPVLAELARHRPLTNAEQRLGIAVADRLHATAATKSETCLYGGLVGEATALRMLAPEHVPALLDRLAELVTPDGWRTAQIAEASPFLTDVVMGDAGTVMALVWLGGETAEPAALTACDALVRAADRTSVGLDWGMWAGAASRSPNYSHGTAGVASALAVAGASYGRDDLVEAAVLGARHLLDVGSLADGGFLVPHTIPPSTRDVEPVTYGWCHGPTGTSYLFAALAHAGVTEVGGHDVRDLRQRCIRSVLDSGVPQRLRPGFWDNDGRCCGTAGVGDLLLDAAQDDAGPLAPAELLAAARTMGDAVVERAVRYGDRACWRFVEHRNDNPLLPPDTTWMQGAAGIAAFLLRLARVVDDGLDATVVDRPDQWWAVPRHLRLSATVPGAWTQPQ